MLARAGFFEQAAEHSTPGKVAWSASMAGLGRLDLLADLPARTRDADVRWIAGLMAAWDVEAALRLLPERMTFERAGCLLALGRVDEALAASPDELSRSARAVLLRDPDAAAEALADWFTHQGLAPPRPRRRGKPYGVADFRSDPPARPLDGPLVSIIVAMKNAARTLQAAVASLTAQTWSNLEVLLVDDASSDATLAVAAELAAADRRIRVLRREGLPGASGARNTGLRAAAGAYVTFHDADDWAEPHRIQHQVAAVSEDGVAAVSRHFRITDDGRPVCPRVFPMVRLCPISVLLTAAAARAAGPFEDSPVGADSEYLARLDLLFGRPRVARLSQTHIVAAWNAASLSGGGATGLASAQGRALREAYERDWRVRHADRLRKLVA